MRLGRVAVPLLLAAAAPAAQLGQVAAISAAAGVTRITIPVTGNFTYTKETLGDKIVIFLKGVRATSTRTESTEVKEGPVIRVRVGNHDPDTTIAVDLRMRGDATFSQSAAGLVVDVRGTGSLPAPAAPPKTALVREPSKKHQKAAVRAEEARVDLQSVPEVPASFSARDSQKESPPIAAPPEARPEVSAKPVDPPAPPTPKPAVRVSPGLSEKDLFPDTIAGPSLPAVGESQVDIATDIALFTAEDKDNAVGGVLKRYGGFVAFGSPKDPGYATQMIRAADWSMWVLPEGIVSLAEYRAFQFADDRHGIVEELRQKHRIPPDLVAYAVFPDPFDRILMQQIRRFAARQGQSGKVVAARIAFSLASPEGVAVLQVRVGPVGRR